MNFLIIAGAGVFFLAAILLQARKIRQLRKLLLATEELVGVMSNALDQAGNDYFQGWNDANEHFKDPEQFRNASTPRW